MFKPIKRPRMELDDTVADSSRNESSFMEMLGRGSGDILPFIFKNISSVKDKIRLERVCKAFQYQSQSLEAWSNVKRISIVNSDDDDDDEFGVFDDFFFYEINDEQVSDCYIWPAIRSIFSRCRQLESIHISCSTSEDAYQSVVQIVSLLGPSTFKKLQVLHMDAWYSPGNSYAIARLIDLFKHQLSNLELHGISFNYSSALATEPWRQIEACSNLTSLTIRESDDEYCEGMKKALCGKKIQMLDLDECCTGLEDLLEIVSSLAKQSLRSLTFRDRFFPLFDFINRLSPAQWSSIREIRYCINEDPRWQSNSNWSTILSLPRLNPHLQQLVLQAHCKHAQAVELVLSYLKILNESQSVRSFSIYHNLSLLGHGWNTVFDTLTRKHKCDIMRIKEKDYRVRCPQLGQNDIRLVKWNESLQTMFM